MNVLNVFKESNEEKKNDAQANFEHCVSSMMEPFCKNIS